MVVEVFDIKQRRVRSNCFIHYCLTIGKKYSNSKSPGIYIGSSFIAVGNNPCESSIIGN
jgi:hypothetical protein